MSGFLRKIFILYIFTFLYFTFYTRIEISISPSLIHFNNHFQNNIHDKHSKHSAQIKMFWHLFYSDWNFLNFSDKNKTSFSQEQDNFFKVLNNFSRIRTLEAIKSKKRIKVLINCSTKLRNSRDEMLIFQKLRLITCVQNQSLKVNGEDFIYKEIIYFFFYFKWIGME